MAAVSARAAVSLASTAFGRILGLRSRRSPLGDNRGSISRPAVAGLLAVSVVASSAACGGSASHETLLGSVRASRAVPPIVEIKDDTDDSRRLFVEAVGTPTTRVGLESDLNLSGLENIVVVQGVTITSEHLVTPVANGGTRRRPAWQE